MPMLSSSYSLKCRSCEKTFVGTNAYTRHIDTCPVRRAEELRASTSTSIPQRLRFSTARATASRNLKALKDSISLKKRPRLDSFSTSASGRTHDIPHDLPGSSRETADQLYVHRSPSASGTGGNLQTDETLLVASQTRPPSPVPPELSSQPCPPPEPPEAPRARWQWRPSAALRQALKNVLPEGPSRLFQRLDAATNEQIDEAEHILPSSSKPLPSVTLHVHEKIRTLPNVFGLSRVYRRCPVGRIPDAELPLDRCVDVPAPRPRRLQRAIKDIIYPYPNISAFLIGRWHEKGSEKKTVHERQELQKVLLDPRFNSEDLQDVDFAKIDRLLGNDIQSPLGGSGWRDGSVTFDIPTGFKETKTSKQQRRQDAMNAQRYHIQAPGKPKLQYEVKHVQTRSLTHIMRTVVEEDPASKDFHWQPFTEHWSPPYEGLDEEEVMGELYASRAFRDAERDVLALPRQDGDDDLPRAVFAYMFWSDATHVSQFSNTKLWPGYAFIGNQSMYMRSKPSARAAHHFVYFPMLDDSFEDFLTRNNVNATPHLLAHCRRELFHGVWHLVLDKEFLDAYTHGIVLKCLDGVTRRIYPRIFTYSADYPEKVLIATTRDMGICPCTRCTIPKNEIRNLGTPNDRLTRQNLARKDDQQRQEKVRAAREDLADGYVVNSDRVEQKLKSESYVPIENAFSQSELIARRLNVFSMLVPDKMHEFDLGVWKALLTHVIRILETLPADKIKQFNSRFRQMPTFGRDKIRRFARNVSELSRMAARDYEDILLCIIPCLEGLLPAEDEKSIMDLLYIMNYWNALASLRMHTSSTVRILDDLTTELGKALRYFADVTCSHFETRETEKEITKRKRAEARRAAITTASGASRESLAPGAAASRGRRPKTFSLGMIKLHSLGDYADAVRRYGALEHYSTKTGELEHRVVKKRRARTGNVNFVPQLVKAETRERVHDRMYEELNTVSQQAAGGIARKSAKSTTSSNPGVDAKDLREHHQIAADESGERLYLGSWLAANRTDPALQFFMRRLRAHLLAQLEHHNDASDAPTYSDAQLAQVVIQNDRLFPHATFAVNYTTYDIRRDQDLIHVPATSDLPPHDDFLGHRDIMVYNLSDAQPHPFAYARVLRVFHARVSHPNLCPEPCRREFLWVRWFQLVTDVRSGPAAMRLERVRYVDGHSAFGFVDPGQVIRGCHLMPAFHYGRTRDALGPSAYRDSSEGDWASYYVGRFVDRDMMMRYLGVGIGHLNPPTFPHELNEIISVQDSSTRISDCLDDEDEVSSLFSVDSGQPVDTDDEQ